MDGICAGADGRRSTGTGSKRTTTVGSTNSDGARARAGGRSRQALGRRRSARRAGAAAAAAPGQTPHGNLAATLLLVGRGELQLAATLGFVAGLALADALDAVVPQRQDRHRRSTAAASAARPLRAEMAERRAGRRRQACRHPARSRAHARTAAATRWRSASASMSSRIPRTCPIRRRRSRRCGADVDAETLFLALSDAWTEQCARSGTRAAGSPRIRSAGWRAPPGSARTSRCSVDGNVVRGVVRDDRRGRPLRDPRRAAASRCEIAAGDVHFGAVASAGAA